MTRSFSAPIAEHLLGEDALHRMDALRPGRQDEAVFVRAPFADRRARLHVVGDETVVDEIDAGDAGSRGEGGVRLGAVAEMIGEGAVRAEFGPDQRRFRVERRRGLGGRFLGVVVDLDQLGGILRQRPRIGDDEGHGVADIVDAVAAEDRYVAGRRALAVRLLLHGARLQVAEMGEILAGQDQMNARRGLCGFERTDPERRLGDGRAQHISVQQAVLRNVVGVAAVSGDEGLILETKDRSAHPEFRRDDGHDCLASRIGTEA